jgi:hypothetical protein
VGYIQQCVEDRIYRVVSGTCDIYNKEMEDGLYTAVSGRWDIYSGVGKM